MTETVLIPELTVLGDTASSTVSYIGKATPGSATSAPVWQICKIVLDGSGNFLSQKWANGDGNFANIWDDRATLTYI